jgi:hypothetical protein
MGLKTSREGGCELEALAQDRNSLQALVNIVMNLQIP